ncbi:MAG TPA: TIGR03905 family TSCPD domain-containing protein [Selenomonas sp.]|nr:TIGR03905 family TSCPD domain-containing protein [Selenomonadaceae bacterium]HCB92509.1 TIGR03905 family TSCPD domain-containing protein [Selenomonas sp.]
MQSYKYVPEKVCSKEISFDLDNGVLHNVKFQGGCPGNLLAIGKLLEGADASRTVELLKGNICGTRGTSCADQLAIAIQEAMGQQSGTN